MKHFLLFSLLLTSVIGSSTAQNFAVQVAAFDRQVPLNYFKNLSGIYHQVDHNDIHKYLIGGFDDKSKAEVQAKEAKELGYNARVIDINAIQALCAKTCGVLTIAPAKIRSIFFDFDRSDLRARSRTELNRLYQILKANPDYTVQFSAHTDAKGPLDYNEALSIRRANAAKTYLLTKGIAENRIKISTFGENSPIAKNELSDGVDTPTGRQFNRRVELRVFNQNGQPEPVVEDIVVPASLQK